MAQTYKSEGIILDRWNFKDYDRMFSILTREKGKITARAISAQKFSSKLAGHIEPFVHSQLFFAKSKSIDILAGSVIIHPHISVRGSLPKMGMASVFCEVVDRFTQEHFVDDALFEHLRGFLSWLDAHPGDGNVLVLYAALIQLFAVLGYHIELYHCHHCKRAIPYEPVKFHYELWALECSRCSTSGEVALLSPAVVKVIRFLHERPFDLVAKLTLRDAEWREVDAFVRSLLRYHLEAPLKSESVMIALLSTGKNK